MLCFLGLGTILPLLGYLYRIAPMPRLAALLLLPAIFVYVVVYLRAVAKGDADLRLRFERGVAGGLLGIAGYDLIRVPIHLNGLNPFAAIQSYGVYLTGVEHSNLFSDVVGIVYHTGNGLFFALMFTLTIGPSRLTPLLAMIWALALEGFAVATVFGEVYHLRTNPVGTGLAFFAHLFYGAPLAWMAMRRRIARRDWILAALLALAGLGSVLGLVRPPDGYRTPKNPGLEMVDAGIHSRWTRLNAGEAMEIRNGASEAVTLEFPHSLIPNQTIQPGKSVAVIFEKAGIHQIRAQRTDWRSVLVIAERGGYVTEP
ncbi:MAG: hypothetical protein KDM91_20315 [Verrucomicrobiae bacterium]|nr:hypothetical protein [Verrucomicrobiae bacterium]MCP5541772.1 hypothetical protein [Akkermansiaceae bacterium]